MGPTIMWILAAIVYGILCGGVYTWLSPRRKGTWPLFFRSTAVFAAVGLVIVWILLEVFRS